MTSLFDEHLTKDLRLTGKVVSLESLKTEHCLDLGDAAADGELWNLHYTGVPTREKVSSYVNQALVNPQHHAFVVRRNTDQKIVGCTRFYDLEQQHQNLAIGYTWYARSAQRTAVNTETKLLLLTLAFEQLECISVAFHTDNQNFKSQAAISRIGAQKEGVLRNHKRMPDGRIRHTWCYSIIDSEWPAIKTRLTDRLQQG